MKPRKQVPCHVSVLRSDPGPRQYPTTCPPPKPRASSARATSDHVTKRPRDCCRHAATQQRHLRGKRYHQPACIMAMNPPHEYRAAEPRPPLKSFVSARCSNGRRVAVCPEGTFRRRTARVVAALGPPGLWPFVLRPPAEEVQERHMRANRQPLCVAAAAAADPTRLRGPRARGTRRRSRRPDGGWRRRQRRLSMGGFQRRAATATSSWSATPEERPPSPGRRDDDGLARMRRRLDEVDRGAAAAARVTSSSSRSATPPAYVRCVAALTNGVNASGVSSAAASSAMWPFSATGSVLSRSCCSGESDSTNELSGLASDSAWQFGTAGRARAPLLFHAGGPVVVPSRTELAPPLGGRRREERGRKRQTRALDDDDGSNLQQRLQRDVARFFHELALRLRRAVRVAERRAQRADRVELLVGRLGARTSEGNQDAAERETSVDITHRRKKTGRPNKNTGGWFDLPRPLARHLSTRRAV